MKLTVACVWVRGHVPFTGEYVVRLHSMAARLLPTHRFVCLTDAPAALPAYIETLPARVPSHLFGWWAKVQLFNPALQLGDRVMYFDLDTLLLRSLEDIIHYPAPFALAPDGAPHFKPKGPRVCVKRFNSSVMVWDGGVHPELFTDWNEHVTQRLWGDQDWIGERCPRAAAMTLDWFPRLSEVRDWPVPDTARVVLCKKPKNLDAVSRYDWFNEAWQ
jgi:hypothetical protein